MEKYKYVQVHTLTYIKTDEDGNELENKDGTTKEFRFKEGIRFKPLEYLCEDLTTDALEEVN